MKPFSQANNAPSSIELANALTEQLSASWGVYMEFYVMFMTLNLVALAAVWEKVGKGVGRTIVCVAFMLQNVFSFATAVSMSVYTKNLSEAYPTGTEALGNIGWMGELGGRANAASHGAFFVMWIVMMKKVNAHKTLEE